MANILFFCLHCVRHKAASTSMEPIPGHPKLRNPPQTRCTEWNRPKTHDQDATEAKIYMQIAASYTRQLIERPAITRLKWSRKSAFYDMISKVGYLVIWRRTHGYLIIHQFLHAVSPLFNCQSNTMPALFRCNGTGSRCTRTK